MVERESARVLAGGTLEMDPVSLVKLQALEASLGEILRGKPEVIRMSLVCLLARGHLLIEDVPGVGKTTLAQSLAQIGRAHV